MITKKRFFSAGLLLAFVLVLGLAAVTVNTARAMEVDQTGIVAADKVVNDDLILSNDVVQMAGTVNGNLVAAGADITISGTVNGDVLACGATINVTGTVQGNLFACGGSVTVTGKVDGSLFFGGSVLVLGPNAEVTRNLYAAGFGINIESGAMIGRDMAAGGYMVILDGQVARDINAVVGAMEINGKVGRNVTVDVGEPNPDNNAAIVMSNMPTFQISRILSPGLYVNTTAQIGGKLVYYSAVDQGATIKTAPAGGIEYHYRAPSTNNGNIDTNLSMHVNLGVLLVGYLFNAIQEFLTLVVLGALAVWLIPSQLRRATELLRSKPLPSIGWGLLVLVAGIVALILAIMAVFLLALATGAITLFGLMGLVFSLGFSVLGVIGTVFLALAQFGSKLVVALLIGDWIVRLIRKEYNGSLFWPLLLGIFLFVIVHAIPILGTLVGIFVTLFGFGAIFLVIREWWEKRRTVSA